MMKDAGEKQREFFEKRKMQGRLKNLGLHLKDSPQVSTSGSMDLVSLFIVNQIAAKKENTEAPKVAVLSSGSRRHRRNEPLVLPMSPCSPSQLSLVESRPEYSLTRRRKRVISQGLGTGKCTQLSPVLGSVFSDNSASDYAPHTAQALSPFSTSSASSGHARGLFPLQLNQQQRRETESQGASFGSQPWGSSRLEQTPFQPFSRGTANFMPWSSPSNLSQLETPSAAQVLFRCSSPLETEGGAHENPVASASFIQSDDKVPVLDFLNQEPFEEEVFKGFSNEYASPVGGSGMPKIHLKFDTPIQLSRPQTVPDTPCRRNELPSCANTRFSCAGHNSVLLDDCENSPRCFNPDASDDAEECSAKPCLQTALSNTNQTCCAKTNQSSHQSLKQVRPSPPFTPRLKIRDQTAACLMNKTCADSNQQTCNDSAPLLFQPFPQTQCSCSTRQYETKEMGTQTVNPFTTETSDAATQCSLLPEAVTKAPTFSFYCPPVEPSVLDSATGRQTVHTDAQERNGQIPSPGIPEKEKIQQNWSNMMQTGNSCDDQEIPLKPSEDSLFCESTGKQSGERWQLKNVPMMKDRSDEVKKVTSITKANVSSNNTFTLQEIADILLLLKQRTEA